MKHAWNSEDRSLNIFVKVSFSIFSMVMIDQHHSSHQKPHHLGSGGRQVDFPPTPCGTEHRLHQSKGFLKQFSFTNTNFTTLSKDFFSKYKICTSTFKKNINPRLVMNEAFTSLNCAGQHGRSPPNSIGCQFDEISYDKCQLVSDESLQFNDNS